jgi:hypothetical protein
MKCVKKNNLDTLPIIVFESILVSIVCFDMIIRIYVGVYLVLLS